VTDHPTRPLPRKSPKPTATRVTDRLLLEPVGPERAHDLFQLHQDPGIAQWYGTWTPQQARDNAAAMGRAWETDGVHKWIAYDRQTRDAVGRGGLSYADVDGARRLEIRWAVLQQLWGHGYASEIGQAGLAFAFGELDAQEVVSFTETRNRRSRAVMERLGFHYAKEIRHRGEPFAFYVLQRASAGEPPPQTTSHPSPTSHRPSRTAMDFRPPGAARSAARPWGRVRP
jgi:[ribosomal protein S5]-alanine N-acetyltransferase